MDSDAMEIEESSDLLLNISSEPLTRKARKSGNPDSSSCQQDGETLPEKRVNLHNSGQVNNMRFSKVPLKCGSKIKSEISEFDSGLDALDDGLQSEDRLQNNRVQHSGSYCKDNMEERQKNNSQRFLKKKKVHSPEKKFKLQSNSDSMLNHKQQHISNLFINNPEIPHINICKNEEGKKELLFSEKSFGDLGLHPHLVSCLENRFNICKMTEVQEKTIPLLLDKKDALIKSCTGSGKTLAYAIPIMQKLQEIRPKIQRSYGIYALIILPTRELVLQSFDCFSKLSKAFTWIVPGYLIGGEKKKSEKARIRKGINVLISTPGRLLDHLEHTSNLTLSKIEWLIIDEADKLLEQGFEDAVLKIISFCSTHEKLPQRQTVLLSATLSRSVEQLAGISLRNPVYIDIATISEDTAKMEDLVVPSQLKQFVVIAPTKLRLVSLAAFIIDKCVISKAKSLIFMSSQRSVDFHFVLFDVVLKLLLKAKGYSAKFFKLHGNMKQEDRSEVFNKFRTSDIGILLCTDVAARGLHLPHVDWIVQYSVPTTIEWYVHRVGRTARIGRKGQSLLFLIPSEIKFINMLQQHSLHLKEIAVNDMIASLLFLNDSVPRKLKQQSQSKTVENSATNLQLKFEEFVYSEESAHSCAKEAFLSFVQAYSSYPKSLRSAIPFKLLHLGHVAKSFCLRESPSELGCHFTKRSLPMQQMSKPTKEVKKRKHISEVSEYSSGFDEWKDENNQPNKKRKRN